MTSSQAETPPPRPPVSWGAVAQLGLGLAGAIFFWSQALAAATMGFMPVLQELLPGVERATLFALILSGVLLGGFFLLSALYALRDLTGREGPLRWHSAWMRLQRRVFVLAPPLFAAALLLGVAVEGRPPWSWVFFPLAHVTAAFVPVWWWLSVGSRGLPLALSPQHRWRVISAGLSLGPLGSILAEIGLLLFGIVLALVILGNQPYMAAYLEILMRRLAASGGNPHLAARVLRSVLSESPWLGFLVLAVFGAVVPLVEEAFKPLGMWLLMGRGLSPAEGLWAGMVSGGMFSLLEGLFSGSGGGQWAIVALGRVGTTLMHVTASGLVGYALAAAWEKRRYVQLGGAYLLAVSLHGLWNVSVIVLSGFAAGMQITAVWGWLAALLLGVVLAACLFILSRLRSGLAAAQGEAAS